MNVLVIKPSSLGDVIHALPFLHSFKESFPEARVDWLISSNIMGILENNPLINELIVIEKDNWKNIKRFKKTVREITNLKKELQARNYDIVVDLQGLLRSGLMALSTRGALKVGFDNAREGSSLVYDKKIAVNSASHAVDRCLEVARALGAKVSKIRFPITVDTKSKELVENMLLGIKEYMVIFPSARWFTKRWPVEKFTSLVKRIPLPVVISGTEADSALAKKIIDVVSGDKERAVIDLCGKTELNELVSLISGARTVVSNDSGPMHISAALGIPTIAIFGPTDPSKTGPYGWQKNKKMKVIKADVRCSPCRRKKECSDMSCMKKISVEMVYRELKEFF